VCYFQVSYCFSKFRRVPMAQRNGATESSPHHDLHQSLAHPLQIMDKQVLRAPIPLSAVTLSVESAPERPVRFCRQRLFALLLAGHMPRRARPMPAPCKRRESLASEVVGADRKPLRRGVRLVLANTRRGNTPHDKGIQLSSVEKTPAT
jgi:hypothetical protein